MNLYRPEKIFLESAALAEPLTRQILNHYQGIPTEEVKHLRIVIDRVLQQPDPIAIGKRWLALARQRGRFLKKCPGTKNYICCGYKILNTANNCDLDCTYCILQGYFNNPLMVVYVNIDDLLNELGPVFTHHPDQFYRIGTGELTDSLILEPVTHYGAQLIEFFKDFSNAIIELKTKSIFIDDLLKLDHRRRAVISWSLNGATVCSQEESLAPSIEARLEAAAKCQDAGYWLGFHFDPMIYSPMWEADYAATVQKLFRKIEGKNIAWISLGALRYPAHLDAVIRARHPASQIVYGEFISGKDQKYRYFKSIRIELFQKMYQWIRDYDPSIFVYLCMESADVWQKSFGWSPKNQRHLAIQLDQRVKANESPGRKK